MVWKFIFIFFLLSIVGCTNINFVYENNKDKKSLIYNNTSYEFTGKELVTMYSYARKYFGKTNEPKFLLVIDVEEEKIKRSVQSNQAISKVDYELKFSYEIFELSESCLLKKDEIYSRFSYTPKSSGYNFGSDKSLDNLYNLSIEDSFMKFNNLMSGIESLVCLYEN